MSGVAAIIFNSTCPLPHQVSILASSLVMNGCLIMNCFSTMVGLGCVVLVSAGWVICTVWWLVQEGLGRGCCPWVWGRWYVLSTLWYFFMDPYFYEVWSRENCHEAELGLLSLGLWMSEVFLVLHWINFSSHTYSGDAIKWDGWGGLLTMIFISNSRAKLYMVSIQVELWIFLDLHWILVGLPIWVGEKFCERIEQRTRKKVNLPPLSVVEREEKSPKLVFHYDFDCVLKV